MPDLFERLSVIPQEERGDIEEVFLDMLNGREGFEEATPEQQSLCQEVMREEAFLVNIDWPVDFKERHIDFPNKPAPDGTGPNFKWGSVQLFILQPDEKILWHSSRHDTFDQGPGIHVVTLDESGLRQNAYYAHDPKAWEWLGRLAQIGARTCMKGNFYYDSDEADAYVKE